MALLPGITIIRKNRLMISESQLPGLGVNHNTFRRKTSVETSIESLSGLPQQATSYKSSRPTLSVLHLGLAVRMIAAQP